MKIAVTSKGEGPGSEVDQRFGRCDFFLVFDRERRPIHLVRNEGSESTEGAGIRAASALNDMGVSVLITGNIGPNAYRSLAAAGIEVYVGASGTVEQALTEYSKGALEKAEGPTSMGHH
ncbi:MAG: NifB/NifX family molybdenum-iron cluster-binding protein [Thermoplasmatota archaeon]